MWAFTKKTIQTQKKTYEISEFIVHEKYDSDKIRLDIALIKLKKPVELSARVALICLPDAIEDANKIYDKKMMTVGWGKTHSGFLSPSLQELMMVVKNGKPQCNPTNYDINAIYCVLGAEFDGDSNVCNGDSGSPLFTKINTKWYIFGLTSYVTAEPGLIIQKCAIKEPSYFTKIANYLPWIASKIAPDAV